MMLNSLRYLSAISAAIVLVTCTRVEFDEVVFSDIVVTTTGVDITEGQVVVSGRMQVIQLTEKRESETLEFGVVWSEENTSPDVLVDSVKGEKLLIEASDLMAEIGESFSYVIEPIETGAKYHARAFASVADSVIYGETVSFSLNWVKLFQQADAPAARAGAVAVPFGGEVLLAFGNNNSDVFGDSWFLSSETWSRNSTEDEGLARTNAIGFSIGEKAYVGLGTGKFGELMTDFWSIEKGGMWERSPFDFPEEITGAIAFSVNGKGYVGMGRNFSNFSNHIYELHPTLGWDSLAYSGQQIPEARSGAVVLQNDEGVIIGLGRGANGLLADFYAFNPMDNSWTPLSPPFPPGGRSGALGFMIDGKAYVGMGISENGPEKDIWEYDRNENDENERWKQVGEFPGSTKSKMSVFVVDGEKAWIGLGSNLNNFFDEWWEFSPNKD